MSRAADTKVSLEPILDEHVTQAALFLHQHMNNRFSADEWERGLRASWYEKAPNHGFMLLHAGEIVGLICALYSMQEVGGKQTAFCNPHSWCVLEPFRAKSVSLVLAVIRQDGFNFTMFSPNRDGEEIFAYLGFKPLSRDMKLFLNVPTPLASRTTEVTSIRDRGAAGLPEKERRYFEDHQKFPWLKFLFYTQGANTGFLVYKTSVFKKLSTADIIYISNPSLFKTCWQGIRNKLIIGHGIFCTKIEQRLLRGKLPFCFSIAPASAKFYLSDSLNEDDICYLYSELVALDL